MAVDLGPKLGLLINADIGEAYYDQFRPFLRAIDSILQATVINSTTTTPPGSPSNGNAYLLVGTPTGAWTGHQNSIAVWSTEITQSGNNTKVPAWEFYAPNTGWSVWDTAAGIVRFYNGSTWLQLYGLLNSNNSWAGSNNFQGSVTLDGGAQAGTNGFTSLGILQTSVSTNATSGANVNAAPIRLSNSFWNGTAAQSDEWEFTPTLGTGTNPTSTLTIGHSGSPGGSGLVFSGNITADNITVVGQVDSPIVSTGDLVVQTVGSFNSLGTATSSGNFNSAQLQLEGSYWDGTTHQSDSWTIQSQLASGVNPSSFLFVTHSGSPGGAIADLGFDAIIMPGLHTTGGNVSLLTQTNATSSANSNSPIVLLESSYWDSGTSSANPNNWTMQDILDSGSDPDSTFTISCSGTPGNRTVSVPNLQLSTAITTTSATAGAATVLPVTPTGYLSLNVNGTVVKLPYYS